MGQVLHIEHDEAHALAVELATLTGESIDAAVIASLRARLEQERLRRSWVADMMRATDAFAERLSHPLPGSDHSWLYDPETGLPA